jgi:hypothetical protein
MFLLEAIWIFSKKDEARNALQCVTYDIVSFNVHTAHASPDRKAWANVHIALRSRELQQSMGEILLFL